MHFSQELVNGEIFIMLGVNRQIVCLMNNGLNVRNSVKRTVNTARSILRGEFLFLFCDVGSVLLHKVVELGVRICVDLREHIGLEARISNIVRLLCRHPHRPLFKHTRRMDYFKLCVRQKRFKQLVYFLFNRVGVLLLFLIDNPCEGYFFRCIRFGRTAAYKRKRH